MLKVGMIGFGGGSALIPIMEKELVDQRKVLTERTFTRHTVVANITPGALPVKLGGLAGYHLGGVSWTFLSALAVALPGTAATVGLLASFTALGGSAIRYVEFASVGISAFIIVLLLHYITKVIIAGGNRRWTYAIIAVAAFLATGMSPMVELAGHLVGRGWQANLPDLSAVQLVAAALGAIAVYSLLRPAQTPDLRDQEEAPARFFQPRLVGAVLIVLGAGLLAFLVAALNFGTSGLEMMGLVALSAVTSFGGGEAYVGVADGFFVAGGYVSSAIFYGQIVPVANALPGPILIKLASGVGYGYGLERTGTAGGWIMAACAGIVAIAACVAIAVLVLAGYDRTQRSAIVRNIGSYILPVICGLLTTTSISMLNASADLAARTQLHPTPVVWASVGAIALMLLTQRRWCVPDLLLLVLAGALSLTVMLAIGSVR